MLVLNRKDGEKIIIGENITITVVKAKNGQVKIGVEAPSNVKVLREELNQPVAQEKKKAS
jgi:carbon storage regulator